MIHPDTKSRIFWETYIFIITIIVSIEIPLRMVLNYEPDTWLVVFDYILTVSYSLDIIVHFMTGSHIGIKLVMDRKTVAKNYAKGWLFIDLLATIPFDLLANQFPYLRLGKSLRVIRLSRLFKLFRVASFLSRVRRNNIINPSVLRLIFLIFWILMVAHYIACGWLYITGIPESSDNVSAYIQSLYWTITTMTTIGYGDITPQNNLQTLFTIGIEIIGAGMYGFLIGNIANLIANIDIAKAQFREKLERVNTFLKYRNIPDALQNQINAYYDYLWESRRGYDEASVLAELPLPLKTSVSLYLNREIIEKVPLFKGASDAFIREIILHLKPAVVTPGDYVFRIGDTGSEMYFISKGSVQVISEDESIIYATLSDGSFFGEIALLLHSPRTASIRASDYCDLYVLEKKTFDNVLSRYPDFATTIQKLAEARKAEIDQSKKE
ncbi:MAG: ion transporter [Leptospirales bacterium]